MRVRPHMKLQHARLEDGTIEFALDISLPDDRILLVNSYDGNLNMYTTDNDDTTSVELTFEEWANWVVKRKNIVMSFLGEGSQDDD